MLLKCIYIVRMVINLFQRFNYGFRFDADVLREWTVGRVLKAVPLLSAASERERTARLALIPLVFKLTVIDLLLEKCTRKEVDEMTLKANTKTRRIICIIIDEITNNAF